MSKWENEERDEKKRVAIRKLLILVKEKCFRAYDLMELEC